MIPSAIANLSDAELLVENKWENSSFPVLFVIPQAVVQSFMQQQDRIAEEIWKQVQLSCCNYVLVYACCFDDPTFPKNSKALAVEDTNIQSILFSSPTSQHILVPSNITTSGKRENGNRPLLWRITCIYCELPLLLNWDNLGRFPW